MKTRLVALTLLVAGALALAACGGGSDNNSSSSSSTGTSSTSTGSNGGDLTTFCNEVKGLQTIGNSFSNLQANDLSGAQDAMQQVDDQLHKIDDAAPAEIKSSVDDLVSTFDKINNAIQGANSPQDLQKVAPQLQGDLQDLQQSLAKAKSFGQKNCNL
jgi:hypothetical protein